MSDETDVQATMSFPLGEVLSVVTGRLVSNIDGVYRVLDHMEQYPHFTHGLPDAAERMRPAIIAQVPELAECQAPDWVNDEPSARRWVDQVAAYIGRSEVALVAVGPPGGAS